MLSDEQKLLNVQNVHFCRAFSVGLMSSLFQRLGTKFSSLGTSSHLSEIMTALGDVFSEFGKFWGYSARVKLLSEGIWDAVRLVPSLRIAREEVDLVDDVLEGALAALSFFPWEAG